MSIRMTKKQIEISGGRKLIYYTFEQSSKQKEKK